MTIPRETPAPDPYLSKNGIWRKVLEPFVRQEKIARLRCSSAQGETSQINRYPVPAQSNTKAFRHYEEKAEPAWR